MDKKDICDQDRDDFWSDEEYCGGIDCDDSNPSIQTPRCYADFSEDPDGGCNRRRQYCHDAGECYSSCRWLPELECPPLPWWMCDFP